MQAIFPAFIHAYLGTSEGDRRLAARQYYQNGLSKQTQVEPMFPRATFEPFQSGGTVGIDRVVIQRKKYW
ncbi:MAG: hypothetical protein CL912_12160 [Deltaproteobacteria bacterium]|nr:hypothetical protein [Deltaproteobacteria bacterium]